MELFKKHILDYLRIAYFKRDQSLLSSAIRGDALGSPGTPPGPGGTLHSLFENYLASLREKRGT